MIIKTKYLGPTDRKSSRISARYGEQRITVPYQHELGVRDNHAAACRALAEKIGLVGRWVIDEYHNGYIAVRDTGTVFDGRQVSAGRCTDLFGRAIDTQEARRTRDCLAIRTEFDFVI